MTTSEKNAAWLRIWIEALSAIGGVASILSLRTHLLLKSGSQGSGSFCSISSQFDCEAVIGSAWSVFWGVPLASFGIIFYLALFMIALLSGERRLISTTTSGRLFFLAGAISSALSIVLFAISEVVIGSLCLMCITMYLVNFLILLRSWSLTEKEPAMARISGAISSLFGFIPLLAGFGPNNSLRTMAAGWVALVIGAPLAYILMFPPVNLLAPPQYTLNDRGRITISSSLDGTAFGDYYRGPLDAAVEIVEFADFECFGCRRMHTFLDDFLKPYTGKVRFVFRNYPLDNKCNSSLDRPFHKYACAAAMYSRCAGEQGKFWEALDFLFHAPELEEHEPGQDVQKSLIENGSQALGLDPQALRECIESNRYLVKIQKDIIDARKAGLEFTPSLWVNGRFVHPFSPDLLRSIIDEELAHAKK